MVVIVTGVDKSPNPNPFGERPGVATTEDAASNVTTSPTYVLVLVTLAVAVCAPVELTFLSSINISPWAVAVCLTVKPLPGVSVPKPAAPPANAPTTNSVALAVVDVALLVHDVADVDPTFVCDWSGVARPPE
jgi:hypothetical protein